MDMTDTPWLRAGIIRSSAGQGGARRRPEAAAARVAPSGLWRKPSLAKPARCAAWPWACAAQACRHRLGRPGLAGEADDSADRLLEGRVRSQRLALQPCTCPKGQRVCHPAATNTRQAEPRPAAFGACRRTHPHPRAACPPRSSCGGSWGRTRPRPAGPPAGPAAAPAPPQG